MLGTSSEEYFSPSSFESLKPGNRFLSLIFNPFLNRKRITAVKQFISRLDELERTPVLLSSLASSVPEQENFQFHLKTGYALLDILKECRSEEITELSYRLHRRIFALKYRIEDGSSVDSIQNNLIAEKLKKSAAEWKADQPCFFQDKLTPEDLGRINQGLIYPELIQLVVEDQNTRNDYFAWVLRDKLSVQIFAEFPALQEKISSCGLNGRISYMGCDQLKVQRRPVLSHLEEKIVTLPFEGKEIDILDDRAKITFRGNYTLSIAEIFEIFWKKSQFTMGNLEYFTNGINNWNVNCLGWWDADKNEYVKADLDRSDWWKNLPVFEVISKSLAKMRYGNHMNGHNWNVASIASRSNSKLDVYGNHAYLEVAVPMGDGRYRIYDFGKAAEQFPWDSIQRVTRSCENFEGVICYPDENIFYTHRQHISHSFPMTNWEGYKLMSAIKEDLLKARAGNMVYQIQSENCAEWVQLILESQLGLHRVPNLFRLPYLSAEPAGIMGKIFHFIRALPSNLQKDFLMLFHIPFGAKRGRWIIDRGQKIWKTMANHAIWNHAEIYLPAFLHKQIECQNIQFISLYEKYFMERPAVLKGNFMRTVALYAALVRESSSRQGSSSTFFYERLIEKFASLLLCKADLGILGAQLIPRGGGGLRQQDLVLAKLRL